MHLISNKKWFSEILAQYLILLEESWRVYRENGKLTGPCMFCISGFIHFDGIGETHLLNTMNQTVN